MNDVAVLEHSQTAQDIRAQVNLIQSVMKEVMQNGQHYGVVPGCGPKPTLLKPGAEKLMMTFRLSVDPEVEDLGDAYVRRYRVKTRVTSQTTGMFLGMGVGECSSDEEKYSWREAVCKEEFDAADPSLRREKWKKGLKDPISQIHTNPADVANTILKMAKKRSLVDAILTVTAASDIFTQDIEDMPEELRGNGQAAPTKTAQSSELCVPNYGPDPGKPFSQVTVEHLRIYLSGSERSIGDEKKARFKEENIKMRDALKAEIVKRETPQQTPGSSASTLPDPAKAGGTDVKSEAPVQGVDAAYLSSVLDCEDFLRGSTRGKTELANIRKGFKLADGAYPLLPQDQADYLEDLKKTVNRMQAK